MIVAIIPARGGSKRIKNKNIKEFNGKPIITYTIDTLRKTKLFDAIVVSTDSDKIADIAQKAGAKVPFKRPKELSDDYTSTAPVLEHAINYLNDNGNKVDYFCCVYPAAPFMRKEDIIKGYDFLLKKSAPEVFSVTTYPYTIFRSLKLTSQGILKMYWSENELKRSQDLPEAYHDAGQFYWFKTKMFFKYKKIWLPQSLPVILPPYLVQDIDTIEDWYNAEIKYEILNKKGLL